MRNKSLIILICLITVILFILLVYHGLRHSRGVPVIIEEKEKTVLEVPFVDKDIDLAERASSSAVWDAITPKEIELRHQTMFLPWSKDVITPVSVKVFHNRRFIYFNIRWEDETENKILDMGRFPDAVAIVFPLGESLQPADLEIGLQGKPNTNIWQWKADQDSQYWSGETLEKKVYADFYYPFEEEELFIVSKDVPEAGVNDLAVRRHGPKIPCFCPTEPGLEPIHVHADEDGHGHTAALDGTAAPKEKRLSGRGFWEEGYWNVIFKRSLEPVDPEYSALFNIGEKRLGLFILWNGEKGDRATRRSISDWVELEVR